VTISARTRHPLYLNPHKSTKGASDGASRDVSYPDDRSIGRDFTTIDR